MTTDLSKAEAIAKIVYTRLTEAFAINAAKVREAEVEAKVAEAFAAEAKAIARVTKQFKKGLK